MRHLLLALLALSVPLAAFAQPPPTKVAYMYCSWPNGQAAFKDEFDAAFKTLGWQVTKFENIQAKELSDRLGDFDMVVGGGVSNLDNAQDFAPYAAQWQAFLNRGGVVIATDASYTGINGQWIGGIDPALKTGSATCSAYTKPSPGTLVWSFVGGDPFLTTPHRLEIDLGAKTNWAHLDNVGAGWTAAALCADKKPVLIWRPYGQGLVMVTSYFRFSGQGEIAPHMLENALTLARLQRRGLRLTRGFLDRNFYRLGDNEIGLAVVNTGQQEARVGLRVEATSGDRAITPAQTEAAVAPGKEADLHVALQLPARGKYQAKIVLSQQGEPVLTVNRELTVPELITVQLGRRHYFVDRPTMGVPITPAEEIMGKLDRLRLTMQVRGPQQGDVISVPLERPWAAQLSLAKLPPGGYSLHTVLREGEQTLAEYDNPFTLHPEARVRFNEKNVCLVDGKPFFPLGMYHVAWSATKEQMLQCVEDLAAAGFNALHASCTNLDTFQEVLDRAQARGLKVIPEGIGANSPALQRFKDHPAILAWNSGDEPDCWNVAPAQVLENIQAIHDRDATHPCYTTVANASLLGHYAGAVDVFSNDPYPLTGANTNLVAVANQTAQARTSVQGRKPLWMVPQCFGYGDGGWQVPTPAQERSMTYQALIEGANGLIWYTYDDVKFKVVEHPELWAMMRQLTGEIRQLTPVLLEPAYDAKRFQAGPEGCLRGCAIRDGETLTIMVAHTNDKDLGTQELTVPGLPTQGQAEAMFENRTVPCADGRLSDAFAPYAVHVYRVKL